MKNFLTLLAVIALCCPSFAQNKVRFMPTGTPHAQYAGYYVAKELGFYEEEGLDVEIVHYGRNETKSQLRYLRDGDIEILCSQLMPMISARAKGVKLVNVLQTSQNSSLVCVSHNPISNLAELDGKKVATVSGSVAKVSEIYCKTHGVNIKWYPSYQPNNVFLSGAVDGILTYGYSEYVKLLYSMGKIPEENTIWFKDIYFNCPEDALCVMEDYYINNWETVKKFKNATVRGWQYVAQNRDYSIDVVLKYINEHEGLMTNKFIQKRMLDAVLEFQINKKTGVADFQPVPKDFFDDLINELIIMGYLNEEIKYEDLIR